MSKKRRDKKRDKSTKDRIIGYTKAAAAGIAGVAFFNRHAMKDFKAITTTVKEMSSDLSGKKTTASNLLDALDKRIGKGGSVYKQTRAMQRTIDQAGSQKVSISKIKGSFDTKGLMGIFKDRNEMRNDISKFKADHLEKIKQKLISHSINKYSIYDDKDISLVTDIIRNAYYRVEKADGIFKIAPNGKAIRAKGFLDKKINMLSDHSKKHINDILEDVYNERMEANKKISSTDFINMAEKLAKSVSEEIVDPTNIKEFLKTKSTSRYAKLNKVVNNFTGLDIDLEDIITGSRKATTGEVLDEYRKFKNGQETAFDFSTFSYIGREKGVKGTKNINFMEELEELIKDNEGFEDSIRNVQFGHNIRVKKNSDGTNHFFSSFEIDGYVDKVAHWFSETLPGNLIKSMDIYQTEKTPYTAFFRAGTIDRLAHLEKPGATRLENSYIYIGGTMKRIAGYDMNMSIEDTKFKDITLISGEHGSLPRMFKDMLGSDNVIANASSNRLMKELDIHQSGVPNIFERIKAQLTKYSNPDWDRNRLIEAQNLLEQNNFDDITMEQGVRAASNLKLVTEAFDEYTNLLSISDDTLTKMLNGYTDKNGIERSLSEESKRKIRMLLKGDIGDALYSQEKFEKASVGPKGYENFIKALNSKHIENEEIINFTDTINNSDLQDLMSKHIRSSDSVEGLLNITTKTNKLPLLGIEITRTNAMKPDEVFRREVIKDILLSEGTLINGNASVRDFDRVFDFISDLDVSDNQKKSLVALNSWGIFNEDILNTDITDDVIGEASAIINSLERLNENSPTTLKNIHKNISHIIQENFVGGSKPFFGNLSENYTNDYNKYMSIKRSNLVDLLSEMNIKHLKGTAQELVAGRHDINNISLLTTIPYGMISRLNYAVEDLGIGLSMDSSKSSLDLIKNIALKRILPVAAVVGAYDYLDYEADNITGTSLTAAGARGLANMDLATRKIADATGIGYLLDKFKESSVIAEYTTGSRDFQSYDERVDWYKNGYSPVRSSRFWYFGSSSEFRGEGIAYWQPNYLKRAESNWREIGIYGSAEEKWSHSIIPTLRHPFSTIEYLLDPYWLEKKNMDTRPYPYTGKMFSEGTPWGAILNPTIGELIKPVKMLPEIKERLGNNGVDLKAILKNMNDREIAKARENDNVFVIDGTDIKNAEYTPYAYATPGETHVQVFSGNVQSLKGVGWDKNLTDLSEIDTSMIPSIKGVYKDSDSYQTSYAGSGLLGMLNRMNKEIFDRAGQYSSGYVGSELERRNGALIFNNPVGNMLKANSDFYSAKYDPNMLNNSKINDYINDLQFSASQLSGIYGFLNDFMFGENSYEYRLEQAGNMYSFSRGFWDASVGGLGGQFMEIARRFFPHEDRSRVSYNPLVNDMESWLPEKFLTGDAYASIPKGEMRLPGEGYKSIYELHPDMFGEYGAFDRMKILADVAPSSEEYKLWKKIAKTTIRDEELITEMKEIEYRAKKASMDHDFYEYRYINNPTTTTTDVVTEILEDGTIKVASGKKITMAGIETTGDAVSSLLSAGDKISIKTVKNEASDPTQDSIKAVVYRDNNIPMSADNISKILVDKGLATVDKMDDSVLAPLATTGSTQEVLGAIQEVIAHAKIPFIHNKLLKIETAFESYKNEKIYGSSFQTWDNPIDSFIKPNLREQYRKTPLAELASIYGYKIFKNTMANGSYGDKLAGSALLMATNPAAVLGAGIGFLTKMRFGKETMIGAEVGNAIGLAGWALTNANNPIVSAGTFAIGAHEMSKKLELDELIKEGLSGKIQKGTIKGDVTEKAIKFLGKYADDFDHKTASIIGAGVGIAISILKNPDLNLNKLSGPYIPEDTKSRWELEEYFDRLEYVKYTGLYHEAARRARIFENSNINEIFAQLDKNKKDIAKLQRKAKKIGNKYMPGTSMYEAEINAINAQIEALEMPEQAIKGGKYTKAAIAYKKMAESTVYGLSEASSYDEILRATPSQYKDYVQAFSVEKNEKKRKEILKYASPQMKKLLQIAWGETPDKEQSNASYFSYKKMPGMGWRGWKPSVDLKHVQMKTIQNEGMALSDFGFYESEKAKAAYELAPDISNYENPTLPFGIGNRASLMLALGGHGLGIQNVSVETTSAPGLWIVGDIQQRVSEIGTIAGRSIDKTLSTLFL